MAPKTDIGYFRRALKVGSQGWFMKSLSQNVEADLSSPLLVEAGLTDLATTSPVAQSIAALGDPESPSELAQRLAVVVAMLWGHIADSDLFLPEKGRPLRGVRDSRAGAGLLATLNSVWGPIAARGLMPVTPTLLPGDPAAGRGSTMSTPIYSGKSLEGFLIVQRRVDAAAFIIQDLEMLAALAEGVGQILPRSRAHSLTAGTSWLEQDLAAAGVIQRTFLPEALGENSAGVRVVAEYMPAYAVGGDFYDFVDLGNGRVMGMIGDVSGKGVTAALTMSRVSADVRRLATEVSGPAELLERLNHTLSARMQDDWFVTALCVLLDAPNRRWIFANAGHVLPLLRRSTGGRVAGRLFVGTAAGHRRARAIPRRDHLGRRQRHSAAGHRRGVRNPVGAAPPLFDDGRLPVHGDGHQRAARHRRNQPPHHRHRRVRHQRQPRRPDPARSCKLARPAGATLSGLLRVRA